MNPLVLVLAVSLAACAGPQIKAAYKSDVDTVLGTRGAQRALGPAALEPRPWKVGQWALYRTTDDGKPGYERYAVVAEDDCGIWLETVTQDYYRRAITKVCYARMPWLPDGDGNYITELMDLVQVMISQGDGGAPQVYDFRANPQMRESMKMIANAFISFDWRGNEALPREDVTVPAGSFDAAARFTASVSVLWKTIDVTMKIHADVPIYGIVRTQASTGRISELVDYGETGGRTELASSTDSAR